MVGIYLSGTGNTDHCLRKLIFGLDSAAEVISIASADAAAAIAENEEIFLAYPTQFSNIPYKVATGPAARQDFYASTVLSSRAVCRFSCRIVCATASC